MKGHSFAVLSASMVSLLLIGCTSRFTVAPERPMTSGDTLTARELDRRISGTSVIVTLESDATFSVRDISVSHDSCSFVREDKTERESLGLKRISRLERRDYVSGGWTGMLLGGIGGSVVGCAVGAPSAVGGGKRELFHIAPVVYAGALGALVGGIIGRVTGNGFGYTIYFDDR